MPAAGQHFIPLTRADVRRLALAELPAPLRADFSDVATLLASLLHVEFHRQLEELKELYAPLDPDADTLRPAQDGAPAASSERAHRLAAALSVVLRHANYQPLAPEQLRAALDRDSPFQLRVHVDLDDFAELAVHVRGRRVEELVTRRPWPRRPLRVPTDVFERVVVLARVKERDDLPEARREGLPVAPGRTLVKLFRNVPEPDLEMVLPNVQVRMRARDRALLGVPALVGGVVLLVTKLSASLLLTGALIAFWLGLRDEAVTMGAPELLGLLAALAALCAFVLRQVSAFRNRKIAFMKALTDNLYFRALDHGAGVFHRLVDEAEEEESKEALLAYVGLAQRPGLTEHGLDVLVEAWLARWCGRPVDFECDDALAKLERLGLLERRGEGAQATFTVLPPTDAKVLLDRRWDDWFRYANPEG
jgi:hypothetical protein